MKNLSEAGLQANLEYWKNLAVRYRKQRDHALNEVRSLQAILLEKTGRAYDGQDYLREIHKTQEKATWRHRLRYLIGALRDLR